MSRVVHFEIHAADVQRALRFYSEVFGWEVQDWSEYSGTPYFGLITGPEEKPGINGAVMERQAGNMPAGGPVAGAVLTIQVEDFDGTAAAIERAGGTVAVPKHALSQMAWQGYFYDTENNLFGIHEPDPDAK
jgi:uncharacterized protein